MKKAKRKRSKSRDLGALVLAQAPAPLLDTLSRQSDMANRPEAEVIINVCLQTLYESEPILTLTRKFHYQFQDGYSYSRGRMDAALASGVLDKATEKKAIEYAGLNKADIKLLQTEMEVTEAQAKKALSENNGDIVKTLLSLVSA
ncbi:hypothetical protein AG1IA_00550 [Rhizoctonia solani AG-1 IA]|uniref:Nascent polypeptide-associated complex subunit alpha-like UBA domain-containing protein n=1 Tax=Thanatephorus cucumeris (strain AG1-IA) TaxID=983506 RepID=L8X5C7_THACA|nr:hypothetical protein AG1IA_00550 [Rhizoctonia solani AG-1 IA]